MVRELLPASAEGDLAAVCSWADELRENHDYHWSSVLHFVDTPDFFCNYNCSSKVKVYVILSFSCSLIMPYHTLIMLIIIVFMTFKFKFIVELQKHF